ncbi:MAG: ATP-binding protein [Oscillospiraceae bacterium]|nr:ATP-binding protein [Oscillospiraceae bacterium]
MKIPKRIASAIINSLKGGVVPRVGLPYIAVGRKNESEALIHDVDIVAEGGASFRFIQGKYGSGKSFMLQIIRNYVMDRGFVVADADLSPERRLYGTKNQGLATYKELIRNMSTKTRPEGGALTLILDRWISSVKTSAVAEGYSPDTEQFDGFVERKIFEVIGSMNEMVHGFDFAKLLTMYYKSYRDGDEETKAKVVKWFRGEYSTKTEAKNELGVNIIITDDDWYEYIKLFAFFLRQAGYSGLIIMIDELVNIYKIPNSQARSSNYEKILTMYNDTMQGKAKYLGIIMCGTPQCIEDRRRGVYSYEALRSRLSEGRFGGGELRDMLAPVIRLAPLTNEEMLVLTEKLTEIHGVLFDYTPKISDEDRIFFIKAEFGRVGAETNITPREVIRDFIELLDISYQNPNVSVSDIMQSDGFEYAKSQLEESSHTDEEFAEFEI